MKFRALPVAASLVFVGLLTGCANGSNPLAPEKPSPTPTPVYVTAPLTGVQYLEGSSEALGLTKPSVACKIDNGSDAARPQLGLNSTDLVFDEMVEGGLTRLVAIWHSNQPDAVGPVRSIRPMDPDILSPFGGIVCYSGGQWAFVKMIEAAPVFTASETSEQGKGTFSRTKDRPAPHNVIVNALKLATDHPELPAPAQQFQFAADAASSSAGLGGVAVKNFNVYFPMALAGWETAADGRFLRSQDGKPHTDAADGSQLVADNVVVMQVRIDRSYLDRKYGNVPKTVMVDSGKATVFSAGKMIEANWSKASATSPIVLTDASGAVVTLAPGRTWVELQPVSPEGKLKVNKAPNPSATPSATN
jgi:hypothetical protein